MAHYGMLREYRFSDDSLTATPDASFLNTRDRDQIINGFVQDKITLDPKTWFLTLGSKLEYNTYSGGEVQPNARLQWHVNIFCSSEKMG